MMADWTEWVGPALTAASGIAVAIIGARAAVRVAEIGKAAADTTKRATEDAAGVRGDAGEARDIAEVRRQMLGHWKTVTERRLQLAHATKKLSRYALLAGLVAPIPLVPSAVNLLWRYVALPDTAEPAAGAVYLLGFGVRARV